MMSVFRPVSETNHLENGSEFPEVKPGLMRLYSMRFCPFAQRTRLVLAAKKIPNEVVNINLRSKPDWYFERNPLGKVPCLEIDGKVLYESLITADFLDEVYRDTRVLYSKDPFQKSQDRIMVELFTKVVSHFYKVLKEARSGEESWKESYENLLSGVEIFEKEITRRDSQFYGGDQPGMLDYMIWPWMERVPAFSIVTKGLVNNPLENFPKLAKWYTAMEKDEAVQESFLAPEIHAKFIHGYFNGNPEYDMVVSNL